VAVDDMTAQQMLLNDALQHQRGQPLVPHTLWVHHRNGPVAGLGGGQRGQQVLGLKMA
jgi:hypothetical protein